MLLEARDNFSNATNTLAGMLGAENVSLDSLRSDLL